MDYLGAAVGGAISGLGLGAGTTMLAGGLGSMVDSYISGEADSVEDGLVSFSMGAMSSLISYGIGQGITKKIADPKLNKILSGSNNKVNKRITKMFNSGKLNLEEHPGKIGLVGREKLYKALYYGLNCDSLESAISQITGILLSPLF